jgi:hypothetical protein
MTKISKMIKSLETFFKNNLGNAGKLALLSGISLSSPNVIQNMIVMTSVLVLLNAMKINKRINKINNKTDDNVNFDINIDTNIDTNNHTNNDTNPDTNLDTNPDTNPEKNINSDCELNKENNVNDIKNNKEKTKNNIKLLIKKNDKSLSDPYLNDKLSLKKNYKNDTKNKHFNINVNSTICSIPIFNLRTYKDLDYHFNFIIHDYDTKKINNLIMCKDIHKWMSSSCISNEDLNDELVPIYFIKKENNVTDVYEYLKLFINTNDDQTKICFVQKGIDYLYIKDNIDELIEKDLIKDLLNGKNYVNYNLSVHEGVSDFLNKFLSLVLIPENFIGEQVNIDIENYYENKKTYEYHFNTVNSDINVFNTTL